ncbi:uncharacterized protein B0H18DRAFT_953879 [Fomitopsis serialis]|uniref:uncharacterized protein n=1 Tax=Fomitopsis serialis TaxID=139415 RepID=UPI00200860DB|nr:uncharacterized protein B0H18DRAFT_953879 [Neoantrodia serialis]KAH9928636.1 hypothetical protein B0H18DRAFT_953879 [Neoantrodia serialis]
MGCTCTCLPGHDVIDLTLNGKKYKIAKNPVQGIHGVVYRVIGGRYDGGYAKTKISEQEIRATAAVGALWKVGRDEHREKWIIVKPSPGKYLKLTSAYRHVRHNPEQCWALLEHAVEAATNAILDSYHRTHWLHEDPILANLFFNDQVSQAYLIDWGCASQPSSVRREDVKALVAYEVMRPHVCGPRPASMCPP